MIEFKGDMPTQVHIMGWLLDEAIRRLKAENERRS
jgi:hypothetical protein